MATEKGEKWIFSREKLQETPSRKAGIDIDKELSYRQQAANLIQDMGQRLSVNQLTINTAIVYMHRFYVYHSFTVFSRYAIAPTALFLAAKVEEQPKKLQHVLQICHACLHPDKPNLDTHSDAYMKQAQELVQNELVLLQSLGFEISVDHPHTHVVKCTQLVKASRDLSQMAYFMATNSLHLTTFCLVYKPTVVAAMCIHLSCKWSNYEIPLSSDGKHYWSYMDPSITEPLLETIITEFLKILNRCPTRLRKLKNYRPSQNAKAGQDVKDEAKPFHPPTSSQGSSQTGKKPPPPVQSQPPLPPPPPKEKKQTLSIEEYKKAQAAKTMTKPPHPKPLQNHSSQAPSTSGQVKKPDTANSHSSWPNSNPPAHVKSVPNSHFAKVSKPAGDVGDASHKNMMRPAHVQHSKPVDAQRRPHDNLHSKSHSQQKSAESVIESDARVSAAKTQKHHDHDAHHRSSQGHPSVSGRPIRDSHDNSRTSVEKPRNAEDHGHSNKIKQLDSKQMVDLYYKNPEKLRHYLKVKSQSICLNSEEKNLYMKLQAKEEERRKRKAAELAKQKEHKSSVEVKSVEPPSGAPLTLRIKLGSKTDSSKHSSVAKIVTPSDSSSSSASRKRQHEGQSGHPAKHAKKSDRHKHNQHGRSGSGPSSGENRHRHPHQKHSSSNSKPGIDEAVFQKSLSDAMNKVQQQSVIPTVTLKRASNGKDSSYFMTTASSRHGFDPAVPVPAQIPDDIFEEDQAPSTADVNHPGSSVGSTDGSSPDGSSPESGEIKSPGRIKAKRAHRSNKVTSLFSPDARTDSQLMRSSSGYHSSSQDADFPPPVLLQKH